MNIIVKYYNLIRMKYIILICFIVAGIYGNAQSPADGYEKKMIDKNNIKRKTQWVYNYEGNELSDKGYKSAQISYDSKGNIIEEISYRSSGQITYKRTFKYDDKGKVIDYENFDGTRNKITYKKLTKYDGEGNKIQEVGFDGIDKFDNRYFYDAQGRLREIEYQVSSALMEKRKMKYTGNSQEILVYKANDVLDQRIVKNFDVSGNLLEDILLSPSGEELKKTKFEYDEQGRLKNEKKYYSSNLTNEYIYEYHGNLLSRVIKKEPGSAEIVEKKYSYEDQQRLSIEEWYDKVSKKYSFKEYTYDNQGNISTIDCLYMPYNIREFVRNSYEFY